MTASRGVSPARARPPHDLLDQILALDPGRRGIATFFRPGAALAAGRALIRARRVLIVTGFAVNRDTPETDGPPGAAVLGRALRSLGARVRYVTDRVSAPIVGAALAANRAGDYLSMRGESVAAWNAPLDGMFLCSGGRGAGSHRRRPERGARWLRPCTIGIGDGGNEIGMGVARAGLRRLGPLHARIASVVGVDHLVVAGVSNWGGYGVVAALSRLAGRDLLHTPKLERHLVEACVAAGASDGVTRRREPTVDGLPIEAHAAVVELLRWAARSGIIPA